MQEGRLKELCVKWFQFCWGLSGKTTLPELGAIHQGHLGRSWWQSQHSKLCFMLWVFNSSTDRSYLWQQGHPRWSCKGHCGSMRTGNRSTTLFMHYAIESVRQALQTEQKMWLCLELCWLMWKFAQGWTFSLGFFSSVQAYLGLHTWKLNPPHPSQNCWSYLVDMKTGWEC